MFTFRAITTLVVSVFIALLATGCSQMQSIAYGEPNFNTRVLLAELGPKPMTQSPNTLPGSREAATGLQPPRLPQDCDFEIPYPGKVRVTACVYALKGYIDNEYREYRITLHHLADNGNALADITVLGLNTAGTVVGGAAIKAILHAVAAGVGGSKTIINEDILYKRTIITILNQMDADRDKQFAVMLKEMKGTGVYTIGQARDDLLLYFEAGTFDHGISSLEAVAAANKEDCKAKRDDTKVAPSSGKGTTTTLSKPTATGCSETTTITTN